MITRFVFFLLCSLCLPGCILSPFIQSYKQIGVTESDRQALLQTKVKNFQQALYWGRVGDALAVTDESAKEGLRQHIREAKRSEKIVESKIDYVEFSEDSREADVEVIVKYYKVPFYVVTERIERQSWQFSLGSGWNFMSREVVSQG